MNPVKFCNVYPYVITALALKELVVNTSFYDTSQALARQREAEVREMQRHHETQLKTLKEQLNKEYHNLEEKLRYVFYKLVKNTITSSTFLLQYSCSAFQNLVVENGSLTFSVT